LQGTENNVKLATQFLQEHVARLEVIRHG